MKSIPTKTGANRWKYLAALLAGTLAGLLPTVCYQCQRLIAPEFAGVGPGPAEKLAIRAVAAVAGTDAAQVAVYVREAGALWPGR